MPSDAAYARISTRWSGECYNCGRKYGKGAELILDLADRHWVCQWCVAKRISDGHKELENYEQHVQEFRDWICSQLKCPRCAAPAGQPCRELGVIRGPVHVQRIRRHFNEERRIRDEHREVRESRKEGARGVRAGAQGPTR